MPANLIDLKLTESERDEAKEATIDSPDNKYPYGLQLNLDNDTIAKLDLKAVEVGEELTIQAVAKVKGIRENETEDDKDRNVEIQITKMAIGGDGGEEFSAGFKAEKED